MDYPIYQYSDIVNAIASSTHGDIIRLLIKNNITFTNVVNIDKNLDITIINDSDLELVELVMTSGATARHFTTGFTGHIVRLEIGKNIKIDGSNTGGGITFVPTAGHLIISDAIVANCRQSLNGGAISVQTIGDQRTKVTFTNVLFENNYSTLSGGSVFTYDADTLFDKCTIKNNQARNSGAGIYVGRSQLSGACNIVDSTFEDNSSTYTYHQGTAISSYGIDLTITRTTFTNNNSLHDAGALEYRAGAYGSIDPTLIIEDSFFLNNSANRFGGAAHINGSSTNPMKIINTEFIGNKTNIDSNYGAGALVINSGQLLLQDCIFKQNTTTGHGGAIYGLYGFLVAENTIFTENTSNATGGAIYIGEDFQTATINDSTFSQNSAISGGAIASICQQSIDINNCEFRQNNANSGGAISIIQPDILTIDLNLANQSKFIQNTADSYYYWSLSDDNISQIHQQNIKTNIFSIFHPITTTTWDWFLPTAYNNYDVSCFELPECTTVDIEYLNLVATTLATATINCPVNFKVELIPPSTMTIDTSDYILSPSDQKITLSIDDLTPLLAQFTYDLNKIYYQVKSNYLQYITDIKLAKSKTITIEEDTWYIGKVKHIEGYLYLGYEIDGNFQIGVPKFKVTSDTDIIYYYVNDIKYCCCCCCYCCCC